MSLVNHSSLILSDDWLSRCFIQVTVDDGHVQDSRYSRHRHVATVFVCCWTFSRVPCRLVCWMYHLNFHIKSFLTNFWQSVTCRLVRLRETLRKITDTINKWSSSHTDILSWKTRGFLLLTLIRNLSQDTTFLCEMTSTWHQSWFKIYLITWHVNIWGDKMVHLQYIKFEIYC